LAAILSENGQAERALAMAQQPLLFYERMAKSKPRRFEPSRAAVLHNYAAFLSENGKTESALVVAKEALQLYESLAVETPALFEPDVAMALGNYANRLEENGYIDDALRSSEQALRIRERLGLAQPERFEPDWASSLDSYARFLSYVGRYAEAHSRVADALEIYRRCAELLPLVHKVKETEAWIFREFLAWLDGSLDTDDQLISATLVPGLGSQRKWMGVLFFHSAVLACVVDRSRRLQHATEALTHWERLDTAMQRAWEVLFFIVAGICDHETPMGSTANDSLGLRPRIGDFLRTRRGYVPLLLHRAQERLGIAFLRERNWGSGNKS
jgi:tetratricopeptide (TPR) repeat protein